MGNESSTQVDEFARPLVLEGRNIEAVAKYVKQQNVKKVVVMVCSVNPIEYCMRANKHAGGSGYQHFSRHPRLSLT